jgi:cell division protease FtsH
VRNLIEEADRVAQEILEKRRSDFDAGAQLLMSKETLTAEEFAPLRPQTEQPTAAEAA